MDLRLVLLSTLLMVASCSHKAPAGESRAPRAAKIPHVLEKHGHQRNDDYFWLKERENPKVIDHLNAENAYLESTLKPVAELRAKLFEEMKSRVKEDEDGSATLKNGFFYLSRMKAGQQYPVFVRRAGSPLGPEQTLLDVNETAKGHEYTNCTSPKMSDDTYRMIYACDFVGRRFYSIRGRDLRTDTELKIPVDNVSSSLVWAADNRNFFYVRQDPETLREYQVYRFDVNTGENQLVYEEKDETFSVSIYETAAQQHVFINSASTMTTETLIIDRAKPLEAPVVFQPRERGHEYGVWDGGDRFYVLTNWNAKNFRVMEVPAGGPTTKDAWKPLIAHRADTLLTNVLPLRDWLVLEQKKNGLTELVVMNRKTGQKRAIQFQDQSYLAELGANLEYNSPALRYEYESLRQPVTTYDQDLATGRQVVVHQKEVPGFKAENYRTQRIWITARDGVKIPVSLLMPKDLKLDGKAPMLVYGYGSYGISMEAWFTQTKLSLVDRGWVFAVAHIRGGSELGRAHYENGRQMKKMNTFTDFIDATEALVKLGYADRKRVYAEGGSAGGLLMGAVMNMRPDLYHGMIAEVPFVDVITTMLDDSIPLTTGEYDEWGNPNEKAAYDYILAYSPYDNVTAKAYPDLLVTTGLHDSQVQYWEPAKWVAKLRELKTNDSLLLLKTDMSAGHGGASGRYEKLKDEALKQSFLLLSDR